MTFARYFKFSSFSLIAAGFVAVAATGSIGLFWGAFYGGALLVSCIIDTAALKKKVPGWILNTVVLAYLPYCFFDYKVFSRSPVLAVLHLALFVAVIKLLTLATDRDYAYLYLISFAQLLAASALTVDITFAIALITFLVSSISTLIVYEMRRSNARAHKQGVLQPVVFRGKTADGKLDLLSPFPAWRVVGLSLAMACSILAVALPLFVLLPRITLGMYSRPTGSTRMVSGFSDHVELGTIGTIKQSDAIVMQVRLGESTFGLPANRKWKGIALDYYDGRSWSRSRIGRARVAGVGEYFKLETSIQGTQLLEQTFFLEALSTDTVFAGHKVLAVSNDLGLLQRDNAGNLFTFRHPLTKVRYKAVSDITAPDPAMIPRQATPIPQGIISSYLQLPTLDPRIAALAQEVTRNSASRYDKAERIESYLRGKYSYSLDLKGTPNSPDPLAMFLFDVQRGHCEYFATAMAIMLRQIAIPARLVNGFRAGDFNPIGGSYTVRQYHAHSWVEAWFEPYGWIEFDPTPPDPALSKPAFLRVLSDLANAFELWWWEGVVNYDIWKQFRLINATRLSAVNFQRRIKQHSADLMEKLRTGIENAVKSKWQARAILTWFVPILVFAAIVIVTLWWNASAAGKIRRFLRHAVLRSGHRSLIAAFYRDALELLRRNGFERNPAETPLEFAKKLHRHPASAPFGELTELYNRLRFGPTGAEIPLAEAETLLHSMRIALRHGPQDRAAGY